MEAADWFGATRVVFHPGSCSGISRDKAMETSIGVFKQALYEGSSFIAKGIHLCPETMGKNNQLGNLEEVLTLCQLDKSIIPTIDFGHLHALGQGAIRSQQDYENILDSIFKAVGTERNTAFYVHFSRIEYSAGGEKRHKTYHDIEYGPDFEPLAELLAKRHLAPTIICESQGTMAEDAVILKGIYEQKLSLFN